MRRTFLLGLLLSISSLIVTVTSFTLDTIYVSNKVSNHFPSRYRYSNSQLISCSILSSTPLTMTSSSDRDFDVRQNDKAIVTDLARYAIKGLSGDLLESVFIPAGGVQTFPDDRRYALLKEINRDKFDRTEPEWLHKENFLCSFSAPELMASFRSHYDIIEGNGKIQRLLTLHRRDKNGCDASPEPVLGPIDLSLESGREMLASFFSKESDQPLVCVSKDPDERISTFQFGNTRAGVKNNPRKDTRTVHIVNRATVQELSEKTGLHLNAMRFRPNIIIDGLDPWEEFNWVGRSLRVVPHNNNKDSSSRDTDKIPQIIVRVLTRTVRCEGVGIDPLDPSMEKLDIPKLLSKNYPQHGPYLGVYASLEVIGDDEKFGSGELLSVGDTLELL